MKLTKVLCLLAFFTLSSLAGFAQLGDPGCDPLDPLCPIDGGLSLLIAAGIGLGAKKALDARAQKKGDSRS